MRRAKGKTKAKRARAVAPPWLATFSGSLGHAATLKDAKTGLAVLVFGSPDGTFFVAVDGGDAVAVDLCRRFAAHMCADSPPGVVLVADEAKVSLLADGSLVTKATLAPRGFTSATVGVA